MAQGRISKRSVDALQCAPGKDRDFLWDDALAGFGVAAFPTGRKVYVAQYRQNGRSRRSNIGDHGRLTPDQARSLAKSILGAVESGSDPIAARKAAREVRTFGEVAEDFMRQHVAAKRKTRTRRAIARFWTSMFTRLSNRAGLSKSAVRTWRSFTVRCRRRRRLRTAFLPLFRASGIGRRGVRKLALV